MTQDKQDNVAYKGGAQRSDKLPMYRLLPMALMRNVADALTEGHEKYCEGPWDSNWRRGDQEFFVDAIDHLIDHLFKWITITFDRPYAERNFSAEDLAEDHLSHLTANVAFICWADRMGIFNKAHGVVESLDKIDEIIEGGNQEAEEAEIADVNSVGLAEVEPVLHPDSYPLAKTENGMETQNSTDSPAEAEETVTQSEVPSSPSSNDKTIHTGITGVNYIPSGSDEEKAAIKTLDEAANRLPKIVPLVPDKTDWFTRTFGKRKANSA